MLSILDESEISFFWLTLYLCQFWAFQIQRQIKIRCQKYEQMGIQLSDCVENIVGEGEIAPNEQFLLFPQCFRKLSVADASKRVSREERVKSKPHFNPFSDDKFRLVQIEIVCRRQFQI